MGHIRRVECDGDKIPAADARQSIPPTSCVHNQPLSLQLKGEQLRGHKNVAQPQGVAVSVNEPSLSASVTGKIDAILKGKEWTYQILF